MESQQSIDLQIKKAENSIKDNDFNNALIKQYSLLIQENLEPPLQPKYRLLRGIARFNLRIANKEDFEYVTQNEQTNLELKAKAYFYLGKIYEELLFIPTSNLEEIEKIYLTAKNHFEEAAKLDKNIEPQCKHHLTLLKTTKARHVKNFLIEKIMHCFRSKIGTFESWKFWINDKAIESKLVEFFNCSDSLIEDLCEISSKKIQILAENVAQQLYIEAKTTKEPLISHIVLDEVKKTVLIPSANVQTVPNQTDLPKNETLSTVVTVVKNSYLRSLIPFQFDEQRLKIKKKYFVDKIAPKFAELFNSLFSNNLEKELKKILTLDSENTSPLGNIFGIINKILNIVESRQTGVIGTIKLGFEMGSFLTNLSSSPNDYRAQCVYRLTDNITKQLYSSSKQGSEEVEKIFYLFADHFETQIYLIDLNSLDKLAEHCFVRVVNYFFENTIPPPTDGKDDFHRRTQWFINALLTKPNGIYKKEDNTLLTLEVDLLNDPSLRWNVEQVIDMPAIYLGDPYYEFFGKEPKGYCGYGAREMFEVYEKKNKGSYQKICKDDVEEKIKTLFKPSLPLQKPKQTEKKKVEKTVIYKSNLPIFTPGQPKHPYDYYFPPEENNNTSSSTSTLPKHSYQYYFSDSDGEDKDRKKTSFKSQS